MSDASIRKGVPAMSIGLTSYLSNTPVSVPFKDTTGVYADSEGGTLVEVSHGIYYWVHEPLLEVMRRYVAFAELLENSARDPTT